MVKDLAYYKRLLLWRVRHLLPEHEVTVDCENGVLNCSSKDWLIGKELYVKQNYELPFIKATTAFLRQEGMLSADRSNTVVDIGANLGMICIALLRQGAFDHAIAFEPEPRNFRLLKKNVEQNGFREVVRCYQIALSDADRELTVEIAEDNSGDCRVRQTNEIGEMREQYREVVSVPGARFDTVIEDNNVDADDIDLLWIDIQGHEGHFFKGAQNFLRGRKVPVVTEFWGYGIARSGFSREAYCELVESLFERYYLHTETGYRQLPISEIGKLFDNFNTPRKIASIILV